MIAAETEVRFGQMSPWRDERTNEQGKIGLLSQWTMEGWDEQKYQQKFECFPEPTEWHQSSRNQAVMLLWRKRAQNPLPLPFSSEKLRWGQFSWMPRDIRMSKWHERNFIESVYKNDIFQEKCRRKCLAAQEYNGAGYFCEINLFIGREI